jgi:hypothetical protein
MKGKFWPEVRRRMLKKAMSLFHHDNPQARGITPTQKELKESGYWHQAKVEVLREIYREKHGRLSSEEEQFLAEYKAWLEHNREQCAGRTAKLKDH